MDLHTTIVTSNLQNVKLGMLKSTNASEAQDGLFMMLGSALAENITVKMILLSP